MRCESLGGYKEVNGIQIPHEKKRSGIECGRLKESMGGLWASVFGKCNLEMGSGQKFLTLVGSGNILAAWVESSHVNSFSGAQTFSAKKLMFSIFVLSSQKNLFGLGQEIPRSEPGQPLIYRRSRIVTEHGKKRKG